MTRSTQARPSAVNRLPEPIKRVIGAALDRKAVDIVVLDLRRAHGFTDFFVICSGTNPRHIRAIGDAVGTLLRGLDVRPNHVEGYERAEWILIDCFDFIVHIFSPETRAFYALERLWGNAERIEARAPESPADIAHK
jgi:ribosome-associated protein